MLGFLQIVQIISGLLVMLLVLLHSPKGSGMAAIGDAAQLFSSQKSVESGLNKITGIISAIFIVTSILLGFGIVK
jgi:preprotein translocase subunit SecG